MTNIFRRVFFPNERKHYVYAPSTHVLSRDLSFSSQFWTISACRLSPRFTLRGAPNRTSSDFLFKQTLGAGAVHSHNKAEFHIKDPDDKWIVFIYRRELIDIRTGMIPAYRIDGRCAVLCVDIYMIAKGRVSTVRRIKWSGRIVGRAVTQNQMYIGI